MKQLAILAGGKGTRLAAVLGDIPKPMAPVAGRPVIEHQVELARAHGFDEVVVFACYRADAIQRHLGDGSNWGLRISYVIEEQPLGTAGAILAGLDRLAERFVVAYGDTVINLDLSAMYAAHVGRNADATLFVHPNDHPHDSDLVEIDDDSWVRAFHPYPHPEGAYFRNLVNAALYVVEKKSLAAFAQPGTKLDFGKDVFPAMARQGGRLFGYRATGYIKDMGTPERLARVERDWNSGLIAERGGGRPSRAVFLDRDGVLNEEVNRVSHPDQLRLIPGVADAVRELNRGGFLTIVITNQPVIARGDCTEAELRIIHNKLETLLGAEGAFLNDIRYCPHHPDKGFPGERPELKMECRCRKPAPGLILDAAADWGIDLSRSWFIGDTTADIRAAHNAGLRSVLLHTGHGGSDAKYPDRADAEFDTLKEAAEFVLRQR